MITREDLNGKKLEEVRDLLTKEAEEYNKSIVGKTLEELENEETILIDAQKAYDTYIKESKYPLADSVEFEGKTYTRDEVMKRVVSLLDDMEVEWSYTLGMHQLAQFWGDKSNKEITYGIYDSTARILGGRKYKGTINWKNILIINDYLSSCHELYGLDLSYLLFLSQCHNYIMDAMKKLEDAGKEGKDLNDAGNAPM